MNSRSDKTTGKLPDADLELLSRYSDGEMDPMEIQRFERRLENETQLRLGLARFEELNHRLHEALSAKATIPNDVSALLVDAGQEPAVTPSTAQRAEQVGGVPLEKPENGTAGKVLPFPAKRGAIRGRSGGVAWGGAVAASIAIVVTAAIVLIGQDSGSQLPGNDRVVDAALDSLPSGSGWSDLADGRELQPVLTFPHRDGHWCREYLLRGRENNWRAVACHDGTRWVTQAAGLEGFMDSSAAYRPAGASDTAPVAVFISQHAADIALDAQAEAELLGDWTARD